MSQQTPRVLVVLAEGAEEMETTIVVDVLRRAGVEVVLAGLDGDGPVTCSRKVRIVPDLALDQATGRFDLLVLPGGAEGARRLAESAAIGELLRKRERAGESVAAICAAPMALSRHAVFAGRSMTSHPSVADAVAQHGQQAPGNVVEDGNLVTSRGPGTAFDFALVLVRRLCGDAKVREVRQPMMLDAEGSAEVEEAD
jgi:protein DJ-1